LVCSIVQKKKIPDKKLPGTNQKQSQLAQLV